MKPENAPRLTEWANSSEIADELGVSRQTVNQMIHAGEFKTLHKQGPSAAKPQFVVRRSELDKVKETRHFPRRKSDEEVEESS